MDCKTLEINKNIIAAFLLCVASHASAQHCAINKVDAKPFYFSQSGLISEMYEKIKLNDSNSYQSCSLTFLAR